MVTCATCGCELPQIKQKRHAKYCSSLCCKEYGRNKFRKLNPQKKICSSSVGAISELRVSINLMERGAYVFRSLSPNAPCDLLVIWEKKYFRLEVTTGCYYGTEDKFYYSPHDKSKYDLLAVVLPDKIFYFPSLEEMLSSKQE